MVSHLRAHVDADTSQRLSLVFNQVDSTTELLWKSHKHRGEGPQMPAGFWGALQGALQSLSHLLPLKEELQAVEDKLKTGPGNLTERNRAAGALSCVSMCVPVPCCISYAAHEPA